MGLLLAAYPLISGDGRAYVEGSGPLRLASRMHRVDGVRALES